MLAVELRDVVSAVCRETGVPGIAAGVIADGASSTACAGVTNVEHPLPIDEQTLFQAGSITKTVTATAVAQLADRGELDLADPVAQHLPELATLTGLPLCDTTVEHLLSHQAGFDGDQLFVMRTAEGFAELADAHRLFAPGEGCSYNNAAFALAGEIVAKVAGSPYSRFVSDALFRPLGMDHSFFTADEAITHRVAAPHACFGDLPMVVRGLGWQPGWELGLRDAPAGGLVCSVTDLLAWARYNVEGPPAGSTGLPSLATLRRLHTPVTRIDDTLEIGLDWFVRDERGVRTVSHPGGTAGYTSELLLIPEHGAALVVLVNDSVQAGTAIARLKDWLLDLVGAVPATRREGHVVDVGAYEGSYRAPMALLEVTAGVEPGTIDVSVNARDDVAGWPTTFPPFPYEPEAHARFVSHDHALDEVQPGRMLRFDAASSHAEWMTWGFRRAMRVDSRP